MDMAFLRRAQRLQARDRPSRLDHAMLLTLIAARHSASGALRPGAVITMTGEAAGEEEPLVELLLGGPRWRHALSVQRGCFNRAVAGRGINGR
jgi:hypothetical protein